MPEVPPPAESFDVAIVGTGPTGLATALCLCEVFERVAVIGPGQPRDGRREDRRTAALFAGSIEMLRNLEVWQECEPQSAPLNGIRLIDARSAIVRAPEVLFSARDVDLLTFGYNVPNWILSSALWSRLQARVDRITWVETTAVTAIEANASGHAISCSDHVTLTAQRVVGADGRRSICRQAAGIETKAWSYPQTAVTCTFNHDRAHRGISTEFHTEHGPCTVVPMPGDRSSLVWVTSTAHAQALMSAETDIFAKQLEARLGGLLGDVENITPRTAFPLHAMLANMFAQNGTYLVGEAAHVMPPIGAQGLNLGLRDAADLTDVLATCPPDFSVDDTCQAYHRKRRFDIHSRTNAVDLFNRSLLSSLLPVHLTRGAGLHLLNIVQPLKRWVIREGLVPSASKALLMQPGGMRRLRRRTADGDQGAMSPNPDSLGHPRNYRTPHTLPT